jgi:hypothetical protein
MLGQCLNAGLLVVGKVAVDDQGERVVLTRVPERSRHRIEGTNRIAKVAEFETKLACERLIGRDQEHWQRSVCGGGCIALDKRPWRRVALPEGLADGSLKRFKRGLNGFRWGVLVMRLKSVAQCPRSIADLREAEGSARAGETMRQRAGRAQARLLSGGRTQGILQPLHPFWQLLDKAALQCRESACEGFLTQGRAPPHGAISGAPDLQGSWDRRACG